MLERRTAVTHPFRDDREALEQAANIEHAAKARAIRLERRTRMLGCVGASIGAIVVAAAAFAGICALVFAYLIVETFSHLR